MFVHKLRNLYIILSAVFLVEAGRLFHLQILSVEKDYAGQAHSRLYRGETIEPARGTICDRNGEPLAADTPRFDLTIMYDQLARPEAWVDSVQGLTGVPRPDLLNRAQEIVAWVQRIRRTVPPKFKKIREETIAHTVVSAIPLAAVARIAEQPEKYPGLSVRVAHVRTYLGGELACHALGYLGTLQENEPSPPTPPSAPAQRVYLPGDAVGKDGVERQYDTSLQGTAGQNLFKKSLLFGGEEHIVAKPAVAGHTVWLTIDSRIQRAAERALRGNIGGIVVMDVQTGAILALASSPAYDLNQFRRDWPQLSAKEANQPFVNRCIQDPVMLASVMKLADSTAALQDGIIDERTRKTCAGSLKIGSRVFACSEGYAHGTIAVREALEYSCNCFFYQVGIACGVNRIAAWARALGLGSRTGIDLPHELPGRIPDPQWMQSHAARPWYDGDTANLSIGHGDVQVTPVQVAVMTAAIANGGKIVRPHVMMKITDAQNRVLADEGPNNVIRALNVSEQTLRIIREGMELAVENGTAHRVRGLKELHVSGKTGTGRPGAQHTYTAWFVGFAPRENPRLCIAVEIQKTPRYGSDVAAPLASEVLAAAFAPPRLIGAEQALVER